MKRTALIFAIICIFLITCSSAQALVINVPADQPTIQAGIVAASPGDTVLVADGTYYENIDFLGKAITVTSVNGPAATTIDGGGLDYVVTFQSFEGRDSLLEEFTITNGTGGVHCLGADESNLTSPTLRGNIITGNLATHGGGISIAYSDALIEENIITSNTASTGGAYGGAGIYAYGGDHALIRNNEITGNIAAGSGGGIALWYSDLEVTGNTISGNQAAWGGGIYLDHSEALITRNEISANTVTYDGGGIEVQQGYNPEIRDNVITGNQATEKGGGINSFLYYAISISGNLISGNSADKGGGMACERSEAYISNNLISDNTAQTRAGGLHLTGCNPTYLSNNTITGNQALGVGAYAGGVYAYNTQLSMTNDILFFNTAPVAEAKEIRWAYGSWIQLSYCDVEGGQSSVSVDDPGDLTWGPGMIDADPLFVSGPFGEFYLSHTLAGQPADSPCRNAGSDTASATSYDTTTLGPLYMNQMTTRTDQAADSGVVDLGRHYPGWPTSTVSAGLIGQPDSETLPFGVQFSANLQNRYLAQTRRFAAKVDVDLAGAGFIANWRAGWANVLRGETLTTNWQQYFPALGSLVGVNQFTFTAADVTPAPYNQPPYPPSGDTDTDTTTVTASAPCAGTPVAKPTPAVRHGRGGSISSPRVDDLRRRWRPGLQYSPPPPPRSLSAKRGSAA